MKSRVLHFVLISLTPIFCKSQNLISNPSFEDYSQCPYALGQVDFCQGWYSSLGSCDYYNQCKPDYGVGVPDNLNGSQYPFDGSGYCGIVTLDNVDPDYREVLSCELSAPLEVGNTYYFSMRYCRGGEGSQNSLASNNLGMKLTSVDGTNYVDNSALIWNSEIILDSISWSILSGSFVASEAYQNIHIGNFFDDTNTLATQDGNQSSTWAYYFIDDVRLSSDSTDMHVNVEQLIPVFNPSAIVISDSKIVCLSFLSPSDRVYVFNSSGILCKYMESAEDAIIDFGEIPVGLYFMKYFNKDETYHTVKILIE